MFKEISQTTIRNDCIKAFKEQKVTLQEIFIDAKERFLLPTYM
jgi:ABC-type uncharacterized transport system ATPase subunit